MESLLEAYREQTLTFLFVLTRVSGLLLAAPTLGVRAAPKSVRFFLALALSILVVSVHWNAEQPPTDGKRLVAAFCLEAALGLSFQ